MEDLVSDGLQRAQTLNVRNLRVLVTGHTGFKGAWLCEWLLQSGAQVAGVALPPHGPDSLFSRLRLGERVRHTLCDIRDATALAEAVRVADPEIVFHLAAQALVRRSYREPTLTWQTNVQGTLNVLEAARGLRRSVTVIAVTTDKVYKNREWEFAYRESDELGGHDPYSASKAACELAVASWRASFGSRDGVTVVTARAGNVLGGGDWNEDRLVPDCFRAWNGGRVVELRQPGATRPWQHVLDPLCGYLTLAAHVRAHGSAIETCNFGPEVGGERTVGSLVQSLAARHAGRRWSTAVEKGPHEAHVLALSIDRARLKLGWTPRLTFDETVEWTDAGYTAPPETLPEVLERQLADFEARGRVLSA